MAARSVFKLLTKTCTYKINSARPSSVSACNKKDQKSRSCSRSPNILHRSKFQRYLSKSLQNLGEIRYKDEEEDLYSYESSRQNFPAVVKVSERDPAKEFKQAINIDELEENKFVYELTEGSRSQQNFYDVVGYMKKMETIKLKQLFMHLQPSNLKPFGSNENVLEPENLRKKRVKIVYPVVRQEINKAEEKPVEVIYKKEYPGYEDTKRAAISEVKITNSKMNYSTSCLKKKMYKSEEKSKKKLTFCTNVARHSGCAGLKNRKEGKSRVSDSKIFDVAMDNNRFLRRMSDTQIKSGLTAGWFRSDAFYNSTRKCNTQSKPSSKPAEVHCEDYITVKLKDVQEECGHTKKKKAKKNCFGRLPKLVVRDCPCIEDFPLKEGKPIIRLKKRFDVPDRDNSCEHIKKCDQTRADDNYEVKPKTLRPLKVYDCPCEEREMTDFVIKRLPKVKVPEPKKVCKTCVDEICCPSRSDDGLVIQKKVLPKLQINDCPCIEQPPLKEVVPLKKLKPVKIEEPPKKCPPVKKCEPIERADHNLVVTPKTLPPIKSECPCVELPAMTEGRRFLRLPKVRIKEPPKVCPPKCAYYQPRADRHLKVEKKKLPVFVPQNCPCIEPDVPSTDVKLKRLIPKNTPQEPPKVCKKSVTCPPRADDGMKIKRKELPVIEPKECPCEEVELFDGPPLKRLEAKPVKEPEKICRVFTECVIPRSDDKLMVNKKRLPKLSPGNCPCLEQPMPIDVKPLKKLKKVHIEEPKKVCQKKIQCTTLRADESLKVDKKRLPKLEMPDCPCIEPSPPEDSMPLKRLKKVRIPEPVKKCPPDPICEDTPRADADDWLYWKRVEVKPAECTPAKNSSKRTFSTFTKRHYSTGAVLKHETFGLKYDLPISDLKDKGYSIIIDIKPSAPLILTHCPIINDLESPSHNILKRSHSEPKNCVTFVICKNGFGQIKSPKEASSDVSLGYNTSNRFISTCSSLCENLERGQLSQNQSPVRDKHLQPKNPVIPEKEQFIHLYPSDETIETSARRGRMYCRKNKDEECEENEKIVEEKPQTVCKEQRKLECQEEKTPSLWEKIVNYFKARPNCPSPEEFKKIRLREEAEKAASKAGLCLYDPKEMLRKNEKELPKVITVDSKKEACAK